MRKDSTGRALQLLSPLQTYRLWRGAELAERLEVTERTVRPDLDRLRDLGSRLTIIPSVRVTQTVWPRPKYGVGMAPA